MWSNHSLSQCLLTSHFPSLTSAIEQSRESLYWILDYLGTYPCHYKQPLESNSAVFDKYYLFHLEITSDCCAILFSDISKYARPKSQTVDMSPTYSTGSDSESDGGMQIDHSPLPSNLDYPQQLLDLGHQAPSGEPGTCCISYSIYPTVAYYPSQISSTISLIFTYQTE